MKDNEQSEWGKLPNWVKLEIEDINPSPDLEAWIQEKIPALSNHTVAELAVTEEGQASLRDYFLRVRGRFY